MCFADSEEKAAYDMYDMLRHLIGYLLETSVNMQQEPMSLQSSRQSLQPRFQGLSSPHPKGSEGRKTLVQAGHVSW